MDIQQDHIPDLFAQLIERFAAGGGFTNDGNAGVGLEELAEARTNHRMIVGD
jgi:hypothetical protein